MQDFTRKLMTLHTGVQADSGVPSAVFGSVGSMGQNLDTRERVRVAMWPIIMKPSPVLGLGLSIVLSHLLELHQDVRAYRLFTRVDGDPLSYAWEPEKSQMTVEEWQLEHLDDNVALWGELKVDGGQYELTLEMESDLAGEDEVPFKHIIKAGTLAELIILLPALVAETAIYLETVPSITAPYDSCSGSDSNLTAMFEKLVSWYVNLQLTLWGKGWSEHAALEQLQELVQVALGMDDPFSAWCAGNAAGHGMQPGYDRIAESVADVVVEMPEQFQHSGFATVPVAAGLFRFGRVEAAYQLLEDEVNRNPKNVSAWVMLGILYQSGGRLVDSVDAFQRAIEQEAVDKALYLSYVAAITAMNQNQLTFDEFVLIDPDEYGEVSDSILMIWEVIDAYEAVLKIDPHDKTVRYRQIMQLMVVDIGGQFWDKFRQFVEADPEPEQLQSLIDELGNLEDVRPAINILESLVKQDGSRLQNILALAALYSLEGEEDLAIELLERAESMTEDPLVLAEIDHLFLAAEDPEFDVRLGDIDTLVQAGTRLSSGDFEFLEDALERAPAMIELYAILGRAYQGTGDMDAAIETLLDGHAQVPDDADILALLGEILWETGQQELAFDYLNKGIAANANHVRLLALTGRYLFEDGQDETARTYLARAEMLAPRHPALQEARRVIAELLSQRRA